MNFFGENYETYFKHLRHKTNIPTAISIRINGTPIARPMNIYLPDESNEYEKATLKTFK